MKAGIGAKQAVKQKKGKWGHRADIQGSGCSVSVPQRTACSICKAIYANRERMDFEAKMHIQSVPATQKCISKLFLQFLIMRRGIEW